MTVVTIRGGLVENVAVCHLVRPNKVIILDYDTEGADEDSLSTIAGRRCVITEWTPENIVDRILIAEISQAIDEVDQSLEERELDAA